MRISKFPKFRLSRLWGPITLCADLWLKRGLKQSYSLRQQLSNDMLHATYTQGNRVDSWLLVVGSQIVNLTPAFPLAITCVLDVQMGVVRPFLNIYVSIVFQWYKELFNLMGFDPYNHSFKIRESIGTPIPQMGTHLGVWGLILSHCPAFPGV
jgi:hypothetical protein